jgi:tRNA G18 (ribose-2'-O)-methylase SpoU
MRLATIGSPHARSLQGLSSRTTLRARRRRLTCVDVVGDAFRRPWKTGEAGFRITPPMPIVHITDLDDPRVAPYRNVPDPQLLRDHGLFIAEGRLVVRTLLTVSPYRAQSVLVTPAALESVADLVDQGTDAAFLVVTQASMNELVGFNIHRGCLAIGERPAERPPDVLLAAKPARLVVLENVSNADNVGGIFRCAAAFSAGGVVLGPHCCEPLYRKAIRTSIGASLVVPFAVAGPWPLALERLRAAGYHVVALTPAPDAIPLGDAAADLATAAQVVVLAGAEGTGLTPEALASADVRVRIPIAPAVDSLNVTVAVGIALHALQP